MKRALITGASGFVGQYLISNLLNNGYEVWGGTRSSSPSFIKGLNVVPIDFSNYESVKSALLNISPDVIFHLSGQSSVKYSWDHVSETFSSNVMETIILLDAVKNSSLIGKVKLISIGSSEEYGVGADLPIKETSDTNPMNPYGVSKLAIAKLAMNYSASYGMNIIHARPFNHIGPGQKLGFVTSDFAKQIVDIENGKGEPKIHVGDLSSKRDFTDVRDIVEGYRLLFEKGESTEIYNICSGICTSIEQILTTLVSFSNKNIEVIVDPGKFRPSNVHEYYGSSKKLENLTGWKPKISLDESLLDIYNYWLNMRG
ncbi:GDP-mannose 4,6-dehydratase [Paenibacillus sp. FSL R5-0914]|uniref:GDP-mannose 4,6-dehydratase n=1 Tax=Paenibacillus sp. FSL R5-0914 TaxID=2921665 RepID=UPI0030F987AC